MDALKALMDGPKARGAFLLRSVFNPPWSLGIEDRAPLSVVAMVRGRAWVSTSRNDPALLGPGDIAVIRGPDPYTLADVPDSPPQITIGPDQRCTTTGGEDVTDSMSLSLRTWGESTREDSTVLLSGTYSAPRELGWHLMNAMPQLLIHPAGVEGSTASLASLLGEEISKEEIGQELVLDRLLDLLLVSILRSWLSTEPPGIPPWYRALKDPVVGRALELLQTAPAHPWTVSALARAVGASRSMLARKFNALVGQPPMAYLTHWRLALAADLLRGSRATLTTISHQVGYGSAFALSSAFKRTYGMSPHEYRTADTQELSAYRTEKGAAAIVSAPAPRSR